jgi:hypothetical protein
LARTTFLRYLDGGTSYKLVVVAVVHAVRDKDRGGADDSAQARGVAPAASSAAEAAVVAADATIADIVWALNYNARQAPVGLSWKTCMAYVVVCIQWRLAEAQETDTAVEGVVPNMIHTPRAETRARSGACVDLALRYSRGVHHDHEARDSHTH